VFVRASAFGTTMTRYQRSIDQKHRSMLQQIAGSATWLFVCVVPLQISWRECHLIGVVIFGWWRTHSGARTLLVALQLPQYASPHAL
jgi:hypothetical protein